MNRTEPARRPARRISVRARFTLFELVHAANEIADNEEEALEIVMDVLDSNGLRVSSGVPGRPLHRF